MRKSRAGTQLDIYRSGAYFFELPMAELERGDPALFGTLDERCKRCPPHGRHVPHL